MIYGLISDIHGNLEAFEVVLAELKGVDAFLCLGDIVGYGPDPGACVDRTRELPNLTCVVGNHDLAAIGEYDLSWFNPYARRAIEWTAERLAPDQRRFLSSLRPTAVVGEVTLVHGSLASPMAYITGKQEALECFRVMAGSLCFVGHTHIAEHYRNRGRTEACDQTSLWGGGSIALEPGLRYIINPGAIGQPRDGNPAASFGTYDSEAGTIEVRRVPYDVGAVQEKMRAAGLPAYLAMRLSQGR